MTSPAMRIRDVDLRPEELAAMTMPVTFVTGAQDAIAPPEVVAECAAAAGAQLRVLEGAGHLPFWEDPVGFNALLRSLLAG